MIGVQVGEWSWWMAQYVLETRESILKDIVLPVPADAVHPSIMGRGAGREGVKLPNSFCERDGFPRSRGGLCRERGSGDQGVLNRLHSWKGEQNGEGVNIRSFLALEVLCSRTVSIVAPETLLLLLVVWSRSVNSAPGTWSLSRRKWGLRQSPRNLPATRPCSSYSHHKRASSSCVDAFECVTPGRAMGSVEARV